jgi:hypothetical protein
MGLDEGNGRMRIFGNPVPARTVQHRSRPAADWPDRFAEFDDLLGQAWEIRRPTPTRLEVDLPATIGLASRLADLFQREAACCSFFTFELTVASGEALLVAINVTESKTSVLDALAAGAGPV